MNITVKVYGTVLPYSMDLVRSVTWMMIVCVLSLILLTTLTLRLNNSDLLQNFVSLKNFFIVSELLKFSEAFSVYQMPENKVF